ncbi:MAG: M28 family peptidase [Deltaproteobacteria bacterium]|nr:M28 family peptidase [Deltaproteobacteria bacterium]
MQSCLGQPGTSPARREPAAVERPVAPGSPAGEPRPEPQEEVLLRNVRQLTFAGRRSGEGYFSGDGARLVFQSEREPDNPFYQIYLLDLRSGESRRVSPGKGKTTCGWIHPGGERLLFASTHLDRRARAKQVEELERRRVYTAKRRYQWDFDEQFEIFAADLGGKRLENLTRTRGYDAEGSWSPDGTAIVFASNREVYRRALEPEEKRILEHDPAYFVDLYRMKTDGSEIRRLTTAPGYDGGPFFSADGRKICWRRFSTDGRSAEIFVMNADGGEERQVTRLGRTSWAPFFHPSGAYLVFTSSLPDSHDFELFLVDSEGRRDPVRVTRKEGFDGLPAFSPDGASLSWTSSRGGGEGPQIFLADWNDGAARRLLGLEPGAPALPPTEPAGARGAARTVVEDLRREVTELASERMEGRLAGSEGGLRAAEYVGALLQSIGLEPAGDGGTFFQSFEFTSGVSLGPTNRLAFRGPGGEAGSAALDRDWRPLAFSATGRFGPAGVVFAGYGLAAPALGDVAAYDSFAGLDVEGKWVIVFRYFPEGVSPEARRHLAPHADLRFKAILARERKARGVLVASGPNARVKSQLVPLSFDAALAGSGLPVISLSDEVAAKLLEPSGKSVKELQDALDRGEPLRGFAVPGVEVEAEIGIVPQQRTGRNVLARLPAGKGVTAEAVVVGAHVDHLGRGNVANSLARDDEKGGIHYGADDNASGVAGLVRIARSLAEERAASRLRPRRDVLFAGWSGEELGLLGSSHFTRARKHGQKIVAYLNLDMIGRLRERLILQGVASSAAWPAEIERAGAPVGLPILLQDDTYVPTDATSFYVRGVPFLSAFTGGHEDYHTPRDTADRIDYEGIEQVSRLMLGLTRALAQTSRLPGYRKIGKPARSERGNLRAYLGTIPDYAQTAVAGVLLAGVAAGGPAERAGLRAGDVIVELAGRRIDNIYDYTYGLGSVRIGEAVAIHVLREGKRFERTIVPESRE